MDLYNRFSYWRNNMLRKTLGFFFALVLLLTSLSFAEETYFSVEDEVDINDLGMIVEEETVREKKDSDGAFLMTLTFTGDFTIGGDNYHHKDLFTPELKKHDNDINFVMQNVKSLFMDDDLTVVNFEGTLTDTKFVPNKKKENEFLFNITPSAVSVLPDNGVEAVSLANNHVFDHGTEGFTDTQNALDGAGVLYSTSTKPAIYSYKDQIQVALLSYLCIDRYGSSFKRHHEEGEFTEEFLQYDTFEEAVQADIRNAKDLYDVVIVSFHWGVEKNYSPTDNQINLGHLAVDAGADLVIGHHPHRIQPIECYNGKYICYSLGNFCFAGHNKPSDMSAIIFQARFRVKETSVSFKDFRIIPIRISSKKDQNDFIPYIFGNGHETDAIVTVLTDANNTKKLPDAVTDIPLEFR